MQKRRCPRSLTARPRANFTNKKSWSITFDQATQAQPHTNKKREQIGLQPKSSLFFVALRKWWKAAWRLYHTSEIQGRDLIKGGGALAPIPARNRCSPRPQRPFGRWGKALICRNKTTQKLTSKVIFCAQTCVLVPPDCKIIEFINDFFDSIFLF